MLYLVARCVFCAVNERLNFELCPGLLIEAMCVNAMDEHANPGKQTAMTKPWDM
jgi:hypothetical protein